MPRTAGAWPRADHRAGGDPARAVQGIDAALPRSRAVSGGGAGTRGSQRCGRGWTRPSKLGQSAIVVTVGGCFWANAGTTTAAGQAGRRADRAGPRDRDHDWRGGRQGIVERRGKLRCVSKTPEPHEVAKSGKLTPSSPAPRFADGADLARRTRNNPVLIGEPGRRKTAIAEGLASHPNGECPKLKDAADVARQGALIAGANIAGVRGTVKAVLDEVTGAEGE